MIALLQRFSLSEILIFIIFLAIAIKGLFSFFDWVYDHWKKIFDKEYSKISTKEKLQRRLNHGSQIMNGLKEMQEESNAYMQELSKKINMLIESDKDDIKSYITRQHHYFCYQKGWIDDFSLDCCEKRYQHYTDEGGNSFIEGFMEELRALPKQPPKN